MPQYNSACSNIVLYSIIIPVYNSHCFLRKCIQSIISQSFLQWELILVDDGSTDGSGDICDKYALLDDRIRVIHQVNSGVSEARNKGLEVAYGDWILFVDSDDYLDLDWLECIDKVARKDKVDIIRFANKVDQNGEVVETVKCSNKRYSNILEFIKSRDYRHMVWAYAFRKNIIQETCFQKGIKYSEDQLFILEVLTHNPIVKCLNISPYHYVIHESAVTSRMNNIEALEYNLIVAEIFSKYSQSNNVSVSFYQTAINQLVEAFVVFLQRFEYNKKEAQHIFSHYYIRIYRGIKPNFLSFIANRNIEIAVKIVDCRVSVKYHILKFVERFHQSKLMA